MCTIPRCDNVPNVSRSVPRGPRCNEGLITTAEVRVVFVFDLQPLLYERASRRVLSLDS